MMLLFRIAPIFINDDDDGRKSDTILQQTEQTVQTQIDSQAHAFRSRPTKTAVHLVVCPD